MATIRVMERIARLVFDEVTRSCVMEKIRLLTAATAIAAVTATSAFAGGAGAPVIEDEVFVEPEAAAGSLGGAGVAAAVIGVLLIGAAISSSDGT